MMENDDMTTLKSWKAMLAGVPLTAGSKRTADQHHRVRKHVAFGTIERKHIDTEKQLA
jgi:hypothetical protein